MPLLVLALLGGFLVAEIFSGDEPDNKESKQAAPPKKTAKKDSEE